MPYMKNGRRDYKTENKKYNSKPEQKKRRAARNEANRKKRCRLGEVHHKDNNPKNNSPSNLVCKSKSKNRSFPRNKKGGHK